MNLQTKHRSRKGWRLAVFVIELCLGLLFVLAGAMKAWDPAEFAREIARYQLVPWSVAVLGAIYLPWLEMLAGMLLLFRRFERGALLIITVLLIVFSAALISAMVRGLNIDCGCFGRVFTSTGTQWPLIRNLVLLACALFVSRIRESKLSSLIPPPKRFGEGGTVV
jgi:putative oxidoreductase